MSKEGGSGEAGAQDAAGGSGDAAKDAIYEGRGPKKIVRIVTVLAYMFSVSSVAIVLSAYYLFLWEPPNPRLLHNAARLRDEPRIHFLRAELPQVESRFQENPEDESFTNNTDETGEQSERYDDFYETLASLRSTLANVLRKRSNDSVIGQFLTTIGGKNLPPSDRLKIDGERSSHTSSDDNVNARKDTPSQEAKFIPGDKSGVNDNTTRTMIHRREEKDGLGDSTWTARQVSEYIVKRHRMLWNTTSNELTSNDQARRDDPRKKNDEGKREEKKDIKTTETQIEKVTARSMTINDTLESSEMPTTLREKSLIEILTETTKSRQVSPDALSSTTPTKVGMIDVVTISKPYEESPSRN
ncbi:hypothetical protein KPH14_001982 [Odynerus spinipes]|uniref:Uncharacterized protein n=1 Tax=Odynerus spinipes TaxID=1348599 RepID=A0AAD9S0Z0_9HYME|nr:hypothetical protein KPH14_001982 [Odynerus spinipes]